MLPTSGRAGAIPLWVLTAFILIALSVMMFRPAVAESTTLGDSLGPDVVVIPLNS